MMMNEITLNSSDVLAKVESAPADSIQYNLESLTDIIRRLKLEKQDRASSFNNNNNNVICQRAKSLNDLNDKNTGYAVFLKPKSDRTDPKKLTRSNSLRSTIRNRLLQSKHLHASLETSSNGDSHPTLNNEKENAKLIFTSKL